MVFEFEVIFSSPSFRTSFNGGGRWQYPPQSSTELPPPLRVLVPGACLNRAEVDV